MADTSALTDVLNQLAPVVDELIAYKKNNPQSHDDAQMQAQIDAATEAARSILARALS